MNPAQRSLVCTHWPGGLFSSDSVSFPSLAEETQIAICRGWEATGCSGKVVVSESEGLVVSPRPQRWPRRSVSVSEKRQPSLSAPRLTQLPTAEEGAWLCAQHSGEVHCDPTWLRGLVAKTVEVSALLLLLLVHHMHSHTHSLSPTHTTFNPAAPVACLIPETPRRPSLHAFLGDHFLLLQKMRHDIS